MRTLCEKRCLELGQCIQRYIHPDHRPVHAREFLFHTAGDICGKHVLDYCCGEGELSVLMAMKGAYVWGFDLSPVSIKVAQKRASVNGVRDRLTLAVCSAGCDDFPAEHYDLVVGQAALHHLVRLDRISRHVALKLKAGGRAIFVEPVRLSSFLSSVRRFFPPCAVATAGERPLTWQDIREFSEPFARTQLTFFELMRRVCRGRWARHVPDLVHQLDYQILRFLPFTRRFAGTVVIEVLKR
jgi:SAM-dependent methyltransferase